MSSSSDDEDLKRAIALSLQDSSKGDTARETISLDSDSETEAKVTTVPDRTETKRKCPTTAAGTGLLGLDRKQMELERLARKRKAPSISPPPFRKAAARENSGAPLLTRDTSGPAQQVAAIPEVTSSSGGRGPVFLEGTVRKTWAFGHERTGNDIKIEEVLQKDDLRLAVLSSFQWDIDWLLAKINTGSTNVTLVMQAKDQATQQQYLRETAAMPNFRLCFPSMEGQINCMHSKLMLLSHPTHLRVVVPTANLVSYDWGETGTMENTVFLIDLPRLGEGQRTTVEAMTSFGTELTYFLEAIGLERSIIDSIYHFDFTTTNDLAFVHSIGGVHSGDSWRRTGYCGLGGAVEKLGLATQKRLHIDFVTSSIGSLNKDFLAMLYLSAQGDSGLKEYSWRNPTVTSRQKRILQEDIGASHLEREQLQSYLRQHLRIYFPTHETVKDSTAGSAGTICFQSKWYNSPSFPREVMRDCKSVRPGMLMHNKLLFVWIEDDPSKSWAYVGSANCSESAWGKLVKDRVTKEPKLNCRNWECGVLVPARLKISAIEQADLTRFGTVVPVPIQVPGEAFDQRKPWFFTEQ